MKHTDIALVELELGGDTEPWERLGFRVKDGAIALGATRLRPAGGRAGISGWKLAGPASDQFDGLRTEVVPGPVGVAAAGAAAAVSHPNGVTRIDHVVVRTPRFDPTVAVFEETGLSLRRERVLSDDFRQGFFWVGDTILELVSDPDPAAEVRFWGLTMVSEDLDFTAAFLGDLIGEVRPAVQAGRRIATVRREAGHGFPLAIMSPHVKVAA